MRMVWRGRCLLWVSWCLGVRGGDLSLPAGRKSSLVEERKSKPGSHPGGRPRFVTSTLTNISTHRTRGVSSKYRIGLVDYPSPLIHLLFWNLQGPSFSDIGLFLYSASSSRLRTTSFYFFCFCFVTMDYPSFSSTSGFCIFSASGLKFSSLCSCFRIVYIESFLFTDISLSRTKTL